MYVYRRGNIKFTHLCSFFIARFSNFQICLKLVIFIVLYYGQAIPVNIYLKTVYTCEQLYFFKS